MKVHHYRPEQSDPLFDPVNAGVARMDSQMAIAAIRGRLGGNPQALASAYAPELALARSLLLNYPAGRTPPPAAPASITDVTALPFDVKDGGPDMPVDLGGLLGVVGAVDPFLMEYADGLPSSDVGWGQLTPAGIAQTSRFITLLLDLGCRTPYLARVLSSNLASHITRSMVQASEGRAMTGALGTPSTKVIVLIASDTNVTALGGLYRLDWLAPGYERNYAAPGGALVFELRQLGKTGEYVVRASYITQTLDQLRSRTALDRAAPPARAPVFIPGCSIPNPACDCPPSRFVALSQPLIDPLSADTRRWQARPAPPASRIAAAGNAGNRRLTGVPPRKRPAPAPRPRAGFRASAPPGAPPRRTAPEPAARPAASPPACR